MKINLLPEHHSQRYWRTSTLRRGHSTVIFTGRIVQHIRIATRYCRTHRFDSTAAKKKRKNHLEPSVQLHAQFESDSTLKRRRPHPSHTRANFSPQRNLCSPEKTHKMHWGGWGFQFCRDKSGFGGPRPLQNEELATDSARGFLYKIRAPNTLFLVHFYEFQNHWPLQSGKPGMGKHVSRMATWNKENPQK